MKAIKNITRNEVPLKEGWIVKVSRGDELRRRYFSDKKHGGKTQAFKTAKLCLEEFRKELGLDQNARIMHKTKVLNQTGTQGVSRRVVKNAKNKLERVIYVVSWQAKPGVKKFKTFSEVKCGQENAFKMAVEFRKKMEIQIYGMTLEQARELEIQKLNKKAEEV